MAWFDNWFGTRTCTRAHADTYALTWHETTPMNHAAARTPQHTRHTPHTYAAWFKVASSRRSSSDTGCTCGCHWLRLASYSGGSTLSHGCNGGGGGGGGGGGLGTPILLSGLMLLLLLAAASLGGHCWYAASPATGAAFLGTGALGKPVLPPATTQHGINDPKMHCEP